MNDLKYSVTETELKYYSVKTRIYFLDIAAFLLVGN